MYKTIRNVALATLVSGSVLLTGCVKTVGVHVRTNPLYCGSVGYTLVPREFHYVPVRSVYILPRPTLDLMVGLNNKSRAPINRPRYLPGKPQRPRQLIPQRPRPVQQNRPQRPVQQNRQRQPFPQPRRSSRR